MENRQTGQPFRCRVFLTFAAAMIFFFACASVAQTTVSPKPQSPLVPDLSRYPGLVDEFGKLYNRLQHEIQTPPLRQKSVLLPLLPETTQFYAAFPNYGDAAHQSFAIFQDELRQSAVLREWWQHGDLAMAGPMLQDSIEKIYQLSQYLGDEMVVAGSLEVGTRDGGIKNAPDNNAVLIAEVRKPGLKAFLENALRSNSNMKLAVRVLDPDELAKSKDEEPGAHNLTVLVRPDFVVAGADIKSVRRFSARLDSKRNGFATTEFGQRLLESYRDGTSVLGGIDLQKLLKQIPGATVPNQEVLNFSGLTDTKYLIWEHKNSISQAEFAFTGPRRGVVSWLASPAPLTSLNLVSPDAIISGTVRLKNLGQIFDDIRTLSNYSNPNAFASIDQMQQAMNLNLKDDLLSRFDGEITIEVDGVTSTDANWKVILHVDDTNRLQQTFNKLLGTMPVPSSEVNEGGIVYHSLTIPNAKKPVEIVYAFIDQYLVVASSRHEAEEAARIHKDGNSLAKSPKLLAAVPPGHSTDASALFYEDPIAASALSMRQTNPEAADTMSRLKFNSAPIVVWGYGEPNTIREVSTNAVADAGAIMVMAAIAVPNVLRAKISANEASAVGSLHSVETAQVSYSATYPQKGFAKDLATLGTDPRGPNFVSAAHAGLIDSMLANPTCVAGAWCTKSGFRFTLKAVCGQSSCRDFVAIATPESSNTGTKNFCSTSDGIIRSQLGPPLIAPLTVAQCRAWSPIP